MENVRNYFWFFEILQIYLKTLLKINQFCVKFLAKLIISYLSKIFNEWF